MGTSMMWLLMFVHKPKRDGKPSRGMVDCENGKLQQLSTRKTDKKAQLVSVLSRFFRSVDRDRSPGSHGICMASQFSEEDATRVALHGKSYFRRLELMTSFFKRILFDVSRPLRERSHRGAANKK